VCDDEVFGVWGGVGGVCLEGAGLSACSAPRVGEACRVED